MKAHRIHMSPPRLRRLNVTDYFWVVVPNDEDRRRLRESYRAHRNLGESEGAARVAAAGLWLIDWCGETLPERRR